MSSSLSEEQLLLLCNLLYESSSSNPSRNVTVGEIAKQARFGADEKTAEFCNAILNDDSLSSLKVCGSIDKNNVRAVCFVDKQGAATIAIRGTGGSYDAWNDNIQGAYETDSKCQQTIREFVSEQGKSFKDITITGHSKGGNLAQYATVTEGDSIGRCVSFDGQGFNDKFLEKYDTEIAANRHKIKSVCGNNDYVNVLLNTIAAEVVYIEVPMGIAKAHDSYTLWKNNVGTQENGEYSKTVEQTKFAKTIGTIANMLVKDANKLPDFLEKRIIDNIGSLVGIIFAVSTGQNSLKDVLRWMYHNASVLDEVWLLAEINKISMQLVGKKIVDSVNFTKREAKVLPNRFKGKSISRGIGTIGAAIKCDYTINIIPVKSACSSLDVIKSSLRTIESGIDTQRIEAVVQTQGGYRISSRIRQHRDDVQTLVKSVEMFAKQLDNIVSRYELNEQSIISHA